MWVDDTASNINFCPGPTASSKSSMIVRSADLGPSVHTICTTSERRRHKTASQCDGKRTERRTQGYQ